jgi:hypothetical protein
VTKVDKLTSGKKAELQLIAELTLDATLAAEAKIARLAERTKAKINTSG